MHLAAGQEPVTACVCAHQPQVAILGTGAVIERAVVMRRPDSGSWSVEIRTMVYLALSYDHRLIDGSDPARYLADVKQRLTPADLEAAQPSATVGAAGSGGDSD